MRIGPGNAGQSRDQVFVDETGRRRRWLNSAGGFLGVVIVIYGILLGASLARAPWAPRVRLPGIGDLLAPPSPKQPPALGHSAVVTPLPPSISNGVVSPSVGSTARAGGGPQSGGARSNLSTGSTTSTVAPGNSGAAPGRTTTTTSPSTTPTTVAYPGNSGAASGRTTTTTTTSTATASTATTATPPGNSGAAPGHTATVPARSKP
jgi:hypothetical protein